jgi:hypothetical protein
MKKEKKIYIIPEVTRLELDNTISLVMMSGPKDPPPLDYTKGGQQKDPFQSPFSNKPFS